MSNTKDFYESTAISVTTIRDSIVAIITSFVIASLATSFVIANLVAFVILVAASVIIKDASIINLAIVVASFVITRDVIVAFIGLAVIKIITTAIVVVRDIATISFTITTIIISLHTSTTTFMDYSNTTITSQIVVHSSNSINNLPCLLPYQAIIAYPSCLHRIQVIITYHLPSFLPFIATFPSFAIILPSFITILPSSYLDSLLIDLSCQHSY